MQRMKRIKLCFLVILILDLILYLTFDTINTPVLFLIPVSYFLLILLIRKRYQHKLSNLDLSRIDQLSGLDFEYYLFYLFKKHHIHTRITSYTHDFGADLIIRYHGKRIVIQAKRWNENVGIKAVQETIGAMSYYKAKRGAVITNSFYTKSAIELANASDILLLNRYDLAKMEQMDQGELIDQFMNKKSNRTVPEALLTCCPYCGNRLIKRNGRYGYFYGCGNYPDCTYTKDIP